MRKIDDISKSDFDVLRDCYDGPKPPPISPTYWRDKLDDAQQMGYNDGYIAAEESRPLRVYLALMLGMLIGFLVGFFSFYRG